MLSILINLKSVALAYRRLGLPTLIIIPFLTPVINLFLNHGSLAILGEVLVYLLMIILLVNPLPMSFT
jgi:hypothetical protein